MREIKFRIFFDEIKEIRYTSSIEEMLFEDGHYYGVEGYNEKDIIMQYIGLNDKNGKEIYEGDILRCNFAENEIGVIKWYEHGFWIKQKSGSLTLPNKENREVIGNIYENKELLNEK